MKDNLCKQQVILYLKGSYQEITPDQGETMTRLHAVPATSMCCLLQQLVYQPGQMLIGLGHAHTGTAGMLSLIG